MKKTIAAALTLAVLGASALTITTNNAQAGYYGGYYGGYHGGYAYKPCHYQKVRVWGHYGYYWKTIKVCH